MNTLRQILEFPSSLLLAVCFLLTAYSLYKYAGGNAIVRYLSRASMARILLVIGVLMLAVEGTVSLPVHTSVLFSVYVLIFLLSLSQVILKAFERRAKPGFILNHLGIFVIVWASFFGSPDVSKCKMLIHQGEATNIAYTAEKKVIMLPFTVSLQKFETEYYIDDGVPPKQWKSHITVNGQYMLTEVNSPCSFDGWTIYQDSYDREEGKYSVLQLVRDPWLPVVYLGMILLAIGAVLLLYGKWNPRITIPVTLVLTILFTLYTIEKINFQYLVPALRSWWFVPHLLMYMVAYSLLVMSLFLRKYQEYLLRSSSALLIIGMLIGSIWARQAWGDYWAWDPKENWAAVTWFMTLLYMHLSHRRGWLGYLVLILSFIALQTTWKGVNYLPSAKDSLHSYNS